jgi:hypothetical protein
VFKKGRRGIEVVQEPPSTYTSIRERNQQGAVSYPNAFSMKAPKVDFDDIDASLADLTQGLSYFERVDCEIFRFYRISASSSTNRNNYTTRSPIITRTYYIFYANGCVSNRCQIGSSQSPNRNFESKGCLIRINV